MTISPDDVRRLVGASEPDAVLVLIEGRPEVIPAAAADSDEFRGALTIATREQLIERVGSAELSAHELTEQAASLDAMISNLGG
jgi:bifunctional DNA-binding transcriptional regulator/antitoxin component of YhaV-PrlF toxin-antitoxin module